MHARRSFVKSSSSCTCRRILAVIASYLLACEIYMLVYVARSEAAVPVGPMDYVPDGP